MFSSTAVGDAHLTNAHLVGVHVGDGVQHLLHVSLDVSGREFNLRAVCEGPQVVLQVLKGHVDITLLEAKDGQQASEIINFTAKNLVGG